MDKHPLTKTASGFKTSVSAKLKEHQAKSNAAGKANFDLLRRRDLISKKLIPLQGANPIPSIAIASRANKASAVPVARSISAAYSSVNVGFRFGARLRELRHAHNLTQLDVAVTFGIDRSFISDVERGRKSISLPLLEILAIGFKLSLSELFKDL